MGLLQRASQSFMAAVLVAALLLSVCLSYRTVRGSQTGTTYYVALTGSDNNPGTLAQPFLTLSHGLDALSAGDTLLVRAGTYTQELFPYDFPSGNSWSQPVTFKAYPGETVILKPNSGAQRVMSFDNTSRYIIVDGFIMDGSNIALDAVKMQYEPTQPGNPHHIRLINCEIKNAPAMGILTGANADYLEFINLDIHDNGTVNYRAHGIYILGHYNLIESSRLYRNANHGIQCDSGPCQNNTVRNNLAYNNGFHNPLGRGIGFYRGGGNLIYNNIAWDNPDGGIKVYGNASSKIYNNTLYHNTGSGIWVDDYNTNTLVRNNIVYQTISGNDIEDTGDNTVKDHNLLSVDPRFVNASGTDFHLQSNSPAIDAGATLPEVPTDLDGVSRPQGAAFDIGAYETVPVIQITPTAQITVTPMASTKATIGVFRRSNHTFYLRLSNTTGYADMTLTLGNANCYPVVGDWNNDGIDTVGVFDRTNALFTLLDSNTNNTPKYLFVLGNPGDTPLAGRWTNGVNHDSVGVFRPSNGLIYLKNVLSTGNADYVMVLGIPGDVGIAGDWDGNGVTSPGVYRPTQSNFYLSDQVTNGIVFANHMLTLGSPNDTPLAGDWTGIGHSGVGVFHPANGVIYLKNALSTGSADINIVYGIANDLPVAGHWAPGSRPTQLVNTPEAPTQAATLTPTPSGTGSFD